MIPNRSYLVLLARERLRCVIVRSWPDGSGRLAMAPAFLSGSGGSTNLEGDLVRGGWHGPLRSRAEGDTGMASLRRRSWGPRLVSTVSVRHRPRECANAGLWRKTSANEH